MIPAIWLLIVLGVTVVGTTVWAVWSILEIRRQHVLLADAVNDMDREFQAYKREQRRSTP